MFINIFFFLIYVLYFICFSFMFILCIFSSLFLLSMYLESNPYRSVVLQELAALEPQRPSTTGYTRVSDPATPFTCLGNTFQFDNTGAIVKYAGSQEEERNG